MNLIKSTNSIVRNKSNNTHINETTDTNTISDGNGEQISLENIQGSTLVDGDYFIYVEVTDRSGNVYREEQEVKIDREK